MDSGSRKVFTLGVKGLKSTASRKMYTIICFGIRGDLKIKLLQSAYIFSSK